MSQHSNSFSSNMPQTSRQPDSRTSDSSSRAGPHSSNSNLPSYDDLVLANSSRATSGSENDMQKEFRRFKSFRSSSMRKKSRKTRPQITIVSSQPMDHHPAFADGSKGSCVPPEAPPSYNEAMKESGASSHSFGTSSTSGSFSSPATVIESGNSPASFATSPSRHDVDLCLQTDNNSRLIAPLTPNVVTPSRTRSRDHNSGDHRSATAVSSSAYATTSNQRPSSSNAPRSTPPSVPTRTYRSLSTPNSVKPAKPPVPKKPSALTKTMQNPASSQSSDAKHSKGESNHHIANGLDAKPKVVASPRKLPPPPRPPSAPKKTVQVDEKSGYASIKTEITEIKNDRPSETDVSGYATADSLLNGASKSGSNNTSPSEKPKNDAESSESDKLEQENTETVKQVDDKITQLKEPTYAVFKKSNVKRPQPRIKEVIEDDDEIEQGVTPPPIPSTRPPAEDYQGIFCHPGLAESQNSDAAKQIADVFGNEKKGDIEDPYSRIDAFRKPDKPPVPKHIKPVTETGPKSPEVTVSIEPPYQTVFFRRDGDKKPDPSTRPLPKPKPSSVPPPLPPFPVVGAKEKNISLSKGAAPPTKTLKDESSPKKPHKMKRKSLRLKEKSKKIFKPRRSLDDFDRPNYERLSETASPAEVKSSNVREVKVSEPVLNKDMDKVKRIPPPRPALPANLKKKLQKPEAKVVHDLISLSDNDEPPLSVPSEVTKPHPTLSPKRPPPEPPVSTSNLVPQNSRPVAMPRHKGGGKAAVPVVNENPAVKSPPSTSTVSKPSRPPPAQKSWAKDASKAKNSLQESGLHEEDKSFLEIANENKNESAKSKVDHLMKSYISSEVFCVATRDYRPSNFTDLSFSAGEKILVLKEIDGDLFFGRNDVGEEGPFPKSFVSVELNENNSNVAKIKDMQPVARTRHTIGRVASPTKVLGKATALYDYVSDNPHDLTFKVGMEIDVIEHIGSDWLKGKIGGKIGIFPSSFVSFTGTENQTQDLERKTNHSVVALFDFKAEFSNELRFEAGDRIEVLNQVDEEWIKGRLNGRTGIVPVVFLDISQVNTLLDKKFPSTGNQSPTKPISHLERSSERADLPIGHYAAAALYDFTGQDDSELSFRKNDIITITGKINDEWLKGELEERTGIFPTSFVASQP